MGQHTLEPWCCCNPFLPFQNTMSLELLVSLALTVGPSEPSVCVCDTATCTPPKSRSSVYRQCCLTSGRLICLLMNPIIENNLYTPVLPRNDNKKLFPSLDWTSRRGAAPGLGCVGKAFCCSLQEPCMITPSAFCASSHSPALLASVTPHSSFSLKREIEKRRKCWRHVLLLPTHNKSYQRVSCSVYPGSTNIFPYVYKFYLKILSLIFRRFKGSTQK